MIQTREPSAEMDPEAGSVFTDTNEEGGTQLILIICLHVEHFSGVAPRVMVEQ